MGLLDDYKKEVRNYITVTDFINLIAFTTGEEIEDIILYLIINNFESDAESFLINSTYVITQTNHRSHYGFDLNTREFLESCKDIFLFDEYIDLGDIGKLKCNFYYNIDLLNSIDYISKLNLNFSQLQEVYKAVAKYSKDKDNKIYRHYYGDFDDPNFYQLDFFKLNRFTVVQASCLLAGISTDDVKLYKNHPKFTELYSDYIGYKLMLEEAINTGELLYYSDCISTNSLQKYLFNKGYVLKGFNDWLKIKPAQPLINSKQKNKSIDDIEKLKKRIDELEHQLRQAKSSKPNNDLDMLLDPNHEYHAPDLKHAIQLWLDLYSTGKTKDDSHSNLAERWIMKNTNYDSDATSTTKRIREISTPLKDFGAKRSREPQK